MKSEKSYAEWYFLAGVLILFIITYFINSDMAKSALLMFMDIILKVIPIFILIFILMAITNYFIKPKALIRYLGRDSGIKGWMLAISAGVLSSGPIYMWYPLLKDLQKQGMRPGLITAFLYNRAVKIPLLPLLIVYFGFAYSILLMVIMIIVSVFQGMITEKIMEILE